MFYRKRCSKKIHNITGVIYSQENTYVGVSFWSCGEWFIYRKTPMLESLFGLVMNGLKAHAHNIYDKGGSRG